MRWWQKRYGLKATPADSNDELSVTMAKTANESPESFWTRGQAERARYFYEHQLMLPVRFWVVDKRADQA